MTRINPKPPRPPQPPAPAPYSPSVPISLYREVATELQANQALMESLKTQNQELVEQNQQLRVEIERVVQSALQLRQKADAFQPVSLTGAIVPTPPEPEVPPSKPSARADRFKFKTPPASEPEVLVTEQPATLPRRKQTVKSAEIGGWWLVLVIFLIVVTAFGTGFLIVRPLLPSR